MEWATLYSIARQRWLLLLALPALGLSLSALAVFTATPRYRADAALLFTLQSGSSVSEIAEGNVYTQDLMPSYAAVARTPAVLDPVIAALNLTTDATALARQITAQHAQNGVILTLTVEDSDPQRAAAIANAVSSQLRRSVSALSPVSATSTVAANSIRAEPIATAATPQLPVSPRPLPMLALGLLGGLATAVAAAVGRELMVSVPVRDRRALARLTPAPVLGSVPFDPRARQVPLPVSTLPYCPRAEGIRLVLTSLQFAQPPVRTLAVTAAEAGDGCTSTATNLAIALSQTGKRVLLVDADLRRGRVATLLQLADGVPSQGEPRGGGAAGLAGVLSGRTPLTGAIRTHLTQVWGDRRLAVLPAGATPSNPSELLASLMFRELVQQVTARYDVVIFTAPPLLGVTDGAVVAAEVDAAVLVVDAQRARQRQVDGALARLHLSGARLAGVLLNKVPAPRNGPVAPPRVGAKVLAG